MNSQKKEGVPVRDTKEAFDVSFGSEAQRQDYYIGKLKQINDDNYALTGIRPKMFIRTYGCQMNERDSEKILGILSRIGYVYANSEKDADFVIYNTCCIRENAENKVLGNLGRLKYYKERNKTLKVALCGCMVQQEGIIDVIRKKYRHVDLLFGTYNFHRLPELLYANITSGNPVFDIWDSHGEIAEDLPAVRKYRWKAAVNIMYGCDNFCAYCIVPYVRGRERSREPNDIMGEIEALADDGAREILLLGQNVNSYGNKLTQKTSFAELLYRASQIKGIERIRFMTPHPKDFSEELINAASSLNKVCKHIHLPLQSGSTDILAKMNRRYTKESYLELANKIKAKIPGVNITTDIITGFPGETDKDFEDTLDVVREVRFGGAFTFIYSKRTGTPAAKLEQLDVQTVNRRFNELLKLQNKITEETNDAYVGKTLAVLTDEVKGGEKPIATGRTEHNVIVHFKGLNAIPGGFANVKITAGRGFYLEGV